MTDILNDLTEKEKELTTQEQHLDTVLQEKEAIEKEIADLRIRISEIALAVKKKEQDVDRFDPAIRQARHNISRMKRERESLTRQYFQQKQMR